MTTITILVPMSPYIGVVLGVAVVVTVIRIVRWILDILP